MNTRLAAFCLGWMLAGPVAFAASPYAGEQSREIKALSADDIAGLQSGQGMGYARAAELNGFAGPAEAGGHDVEIFDARCLRGRRIRQHDEECGNGNEQENGRSGK